MKAKPPCPFPTKPETSNEKQVAEKVKRSTMDSIKTLELLSGELVGSRSEDYIKSAIALLYQAYDDMLIAIRLIK